MGVKTFIKKTNFIFSSCRNILNVISVLLSILVLNPDNALAEEIPGHIEVKEYLKAGKNNLDAGLYEEAIKKLTIAQKEFPLLEDYSLLYISEAYQQLGEYGKSHDTIRTLLEKFPQSPLRKKARISEIRAAKDSNRENILQLFESYVRDYPDDEEIIMMYGLHLKQTGEKTKSMSLFKYLYIRAGALSSSAYNELPPSDIKSADLLERASNLIKRYEFENAEHDLRKALLIDSGKNRDEILRNLGLSLFRQKKYKEAAEIYSRINDIYFKARSLYRAGDRSGFNQSLDELLAGNDKRAGYLLVAVASDKRREKDFENAIKIYNDVLTNYPAETEDAMWGTGWTYYISGEHKKAAEIFTQLYSKYEDPKYLYWQARSIELTGDDATGLYNQLMRMGNNYYAAMSFAKTGKKIIKTASLKETSLDNTYDRGQRFERIEVLQSLGMIKEAVMELTLLSKKIDSSPELSFIISKFLDLGEFRRAVGLAAKIQYSEKLHRFFYPLAFWDVIEQTSKKYNIDPYVALSVIREESRFDADARSVAGARGLMQLMPQTAYQLDKTLKIGINRASQLNNIRNNIQLGTYYLKSLFSEFRSLAHVLAAYNAGEMLVRKWEERGNYKSVDEFIEDIPYAETRNYVKKVITSYFQYKKFSSADAEDKEFNIVLGKL